MHRALAAFVVVVAAAFAVPAAAETSPMGRDFGLGLRLGAPTGLDLKLMTGADSGLVVGVGGLLFFDRSLSLHVDHVWHAHLTENFTAYAGVGGWGSVSGDVKGPPFGYRGPVYVQAVPVNAGVRVPLGLNYAFQPIPVEVYGEIAPSAELFPGIGLFSSGSLGARLYF